MNLVVLVYFFMVRLNAFWVALVSASASSKNMHLT